MSRLDNCKSFGACHPQLVMGPTASVWVWLSKSNTNIVKTVVKYHHRYVTCACDMPYTQTGDNIHVHYIQENRLRSVFLYIMYMYIAESNVLLYFMSMHCNCCTVALFSHLGYYFIKHTSLHQMIYTGYIKLGFASERPAPYYRVMSVPLNMNTPATNGQQSTQCSFPYGLFELIPYSITILTIIHYH